MLGRFVGIDIGAETIKVVELSGEGTSVVWTHKEIVEHHKEPTTALLEILARLGWSNITGAAVSGRFSRQLKLSRVPTKQAQAEGFRHLFGNDSGTVVSIGSHGFSVLELRESGLEVFRENSRCSQGTGNFLRQLVERFDLGIEEASALCHGVEKPAPLSGRCPVILKTDMTHLANKGESQAEILAGLYDAVCENVQVLLKPRVSPKRVALVGGVSRSARIRENFERFLGRHEMNLLSLKEEESLFIEALGCARVAMEKSEAVPELTQLIATNEETEFDRLPALRHYLKKVKRMPKTPLPQPNGVQRSLVLGFDIGSTGSKVVAVDGLAREVVWEGYISTNGNPVNAAQTLMRQFVESEMSRYPVRAVAATGSGREIVGSLLATCYGTDRVYVINEIAAHAEGALHFDPRVDTIFEIGGQDAKYIRLADGRVIDAAMNEACSAGTGSFIEEQGKKFSGVENVVQLGQDALEGEEGISLGQHCSVFMAEIIDEAVAAGEENQTIIAGIYDSIIQNYLNRVKGSRSVGDVVFCQGMPFAADALAAAVVRQTDSEVIIPPNPGTVGALGVALLSLKAIELGEQEAIVGQHFLDAEVCSKDTFICKSKKGCGGSGNFCRIDRLMTNVEGQKQRFTWGGSCSLWDKGTGKTKLPDLAPDPFREREEMIQEIINVTGQDRGRKKVALTDEFQLKGLFPFFATFIDALGFDLMVERGADQKALKRGIEEGNVPFCAPMQQYHGLVSVMSERNPDIIFLPMMRGITRVGDEENAVVCPIVQASPDMLRQDLGADIADRIVSPVIDIGKGNLESSDFVESCQRLAKGLGKVGMPWWNAYQLALAAQQRFDESCLELGQKALDFCAELDLTPIVVLGRAYTIYNKVLNSNIPAIVREQGAIAIPVDCYPVDDDVPVFKDMYWGYGQRNLRAAHQIRRSSGVYSLWCSNYACGPDSFNLHFYSYMMDGKPFAIIETDGHSGDAGTKTRVEAFLHCVREDLQGSGAEKTPTNFHILEQEKAALPDIQAQKEIVLIPRMGQGAEALAAALCGIGIPAEALPMPDRETVRIGRRFTSGKECIPMCITLGSLIQRIERGSADERFAFFMPTACGPCRFGVYNLLHKITLERLGLKDRVRVWSPSDENYFAGVPAGLSIMLVVAFATSDILLNALYDVRPVEKEAGAAMKIYEHYRLQIIEKIREAGAGDLSMSAAMLQVANGSLFGTASILKEAASAFSAVKGSEEIPTVAVVGEIYVRCDPFANDFTIDKLEKRGIRAHFAPFNEWLEYVDHMNRYNGDATGVNAQLTTLVQRRIQVRTYQIFAEALGWPERTSVKASIEAAKGYIREDLNGEAVLTLGGPLHEWRSGHIDGVVSVGPLECMPNKISEAQFFHAGEKEGLVSLTLALNGDPMDPETLDNFAFEVHSGFRKRQKDGTAGHAKRRDKKRLSQLLTPANWAPLRRSLTSKRR
jgi:predicted CoA-substrate-specific enzyme activase